MPDAQLSPMAHVRPHPPQLPGSDRVSTQPVPHCVCPDGHITLTPQLPPEQICPVGQTFPQSPQLRTLLDVSTQSPAHCVCPDGQLAD